MKRDRTRAMDAVDLGWGVLHVCGAETVNFVADRADMRHEAECQVCPLLRAWWRHRLPPKKQLEPCD